MSDFFKSQFEKHIINQPTKFQLVSDSCLSVYTQDEIIWCKIDTMAGYYGDIKFERSGVTHGGIGNLLKGMLSGDGNVVFNYLLTKFLPEVSNTSFY